MNTPFSAGIVSLHKPPGITSRAAVDVVKRLVRPERAGHAGTLDPLATGVLVVCIGRATRLIEYVQREPKRYRATFLLGRSSPTEDVESETTPVVDAPQPTRAELVTAAERLTGRIMQRPPAYSALKVAGRRAYDLARAGQQVELAPRPVMVYAIELIDYEYPQLVLDIRCGAGTYVRSLGRDLAHSLGTAAVMSALVRTAVGSFTLEESWLPTQLTVENRAAWLRPPHDAVRSLPAVQLDAEQTTDVAHGRFITLRHGRNPETAIVNGGSEGKEIAALSASGALLAILSPRGDGTFGSRVNLTRAHE